MTPHQAIAFVRKHGVVLESASGSVPTLTHAVVGAPIRGSWWSHPRSREIFALTRAVRDSDDILVCRVVDGNVTFVHRRLWAPLVRVEGRFLRRHIARVHEVHTASGRHVAKELPFPKWVPDEIAAEAKRLTEAEAVRLLGDWCP
jgi:hypothetical protein